MDTGVGLAPVRASEQKAALVAPTEFPYRLNRNLFEFHAKEKAACAAIVMPLRKIAYVPIPKNACTSLKIFLFETRHNRKFSAHFDNIHQKFSHRAIDFERFASDTEHFKFMVVRDPLERFVSAFNNRVLHYGELSEAWMKKLASPELMAMKRRKLAFNPDINEFAERLEDYVRVSTKIRHHFIPQSMFFHGTPEVFDKIYNVRTLHDLEADLSRRLRKKVKLPRVQETAGLQNAAKLKDVSSKNLAHLKDYYASDFRSLKTYL